MLKKFGLFMVATLVLSLVPVLSAAAQNADCGYAFVHTGTVGDAEFERQMQDGLNQARETLGITIDAVESTDIAAITDNIRAFAQEGCYGLIGISSFLGGEALTTVADEFPDQQFAIFDTVVERPNVMNYAQAPEQVMYVLGMMAAEMTETNVIGAVFGMDIPPLTRFRVGYENGARAVNPDIEVLIDYVGSFTDPARSLTLAITQHERGADIIYSATGSNRSVYAEAAANGFRVIGAGEPEVEPNVITDSEAITSLVGGSVAAVSFTMFNDVVSGAFAGGTVKTLGLADGIYTIIPLDEPVEPFVSRVGADVIAVAGPVYRGIIAGYITVPNPLLTPGE